MEWRGRRAHGGELMEGKHLSKDLKEVAEAAAQASRGRSCPGRRNSKHKAPGQAGASRFAMFEEEQRPLWLE